MQATRFARTCFVRAAVGKVFFSTTTGMLASTPPKRGALVVLEGCDRCGKSTQARMLSEALNKSNLTAKTMQFPERSTAIGGIINSYLCKELELDDHCVHLLFSANRWELQGSMTKALEAGTTLIVDRYAFSGVAFTAAKEGFNLDWCKNPDRGLPEPDLVLYLDLAVEAAARRGAYGEERYERTDFQQRVYDNYQQLKADDWKVLDADTSIDNLHSQILSLVENTISSCADKPIGKLWTK
ncbi:thymidylate kinase-like [Sycon ciliatum]|uniref:thymidylate kinase-like n=1 Tax=Sycon ciliatum TaxID=27933 RepID=UPI0031F65415